MYNDSPYLLVDQTQYRLRFTTLLRQSLEVRGKGRSPPDKDLYRCFQSPVVRSSSWGSFLFGWRIIKVLLRVPTTSNRTETSTQTEIRSVTPTPYFTRLTNPGSSALTGTSTHTAKSRCLYLSFLSPKGVPLNRGLYSLTYSPFPLFVVHRWHVSVPNKEDPVTTITARQTAFLVTGNTDSLVTFPPSVRLPTSFCGFLDHLWRV